MFYKCFDKRSSGSVAKCKIIPNQELAKELHTAIIRKVEKRKVS